jgi:hypothetical protein
MRILENEAAFARLDSARLAESSGEPKQGKKEELNFKEQSEKARQQGKISPNHYHEPMMYNNGHRPSSRRNSSDYTLCRIIP